MLSVVSSSLSMPQTAAAAAVRHRAATAGRMGRRPRRPPWLDTRHSYHHHTTKFRHSGTILAVPTRRPPPFEATLPLFVRPRYHHHHNFTTGRTALHHPSPDVWRTLSSSSSSLSSSFFASSFWETWSIRQPKKGRGFDNFLPRDEDANNDAGDDSSNENGPSSAGGGNNNNNKKKKNSRNKNQNGNHNNNSSGNQWIGLGVVLGLAYLWTKNNNNRNHSPNRGDAEAAAMPREISWHDFLRLLQQQQILKIVVSETPDQQNSATARVYLKPSSPLLMASSGGRPPTPVSLQRTMSTTTNTSNPTDYQQRSDQPQNHTGDGSGQHDSEFYEQSQQQLNGLMETSPYTDTPNTIGGGRTNSHPYLFYKLQIGSPDSFERKLEQAQRALGRSEYDDVPVQYTADSSVTRELLSVVPGIVLAVGMFALMRYASGSLMGGGKGGVGGSGGGGGPGGIFSIGKSTAKKIAKEDISVTFADVAGCDEAKREIMEFVDFLKDSDRFTKLGAKIPKGALLCGPPGTGKTLLAKAVAGEAGVPFYSISGSDFIEMFVGVGPSRVRDLFSEARANAPCIVFIDEIDAVGRQRGRGGVGGNDERENTLNQLLVEMDGFAPSTGVVVLAGTNRVDILDQALTRPGRFDRQITIDKPDLNGRKAIFKVHLQGITLENEVEDVAGRLAGLTPGFAGADIANICNEAAIVAARRKGETVTMADFEKATDRIIGGLESNKIMSKEERGIVAYHEAGHAVAGWFLEHADALLKVTIIPRSSGALGFAQYLPKEVYLRTQDQIMDVVCMALAGRAAEDIFFGSVTTGASDDLKRVTQLVYSTIQLYGMNSRLGQLSFPKDPNAMFEDRPYSEKTAKVMDEEAKAIVDAAYERTVKLLREKKSDVEKVALLLLEKETITHDDIATAIGERPFKGDPAYDEFIRRRATVLGKEVDKTSRADDDNTKQEQESPPPPGQLHPGLL